MVFTTHASIPPTVRSHEVNKQRTSGICNSRTNPSCSGSLRAPKRSLRSGPVFQPHPRPTSPLAHQTPATHTFFASNPKLATSFAIALLQLGELPSSLQILVTSPMSPPQTSPNSSLRHPGSFHTYTLYLIPVLHFFSLHLSKIFLLSPETGFIYLAQIIQSWVITWTVGGELKTCLQIHPLQKRGCVAWSRISFVNWGHGFWNPKLSLPTQLAVYSETTLLVLSSSA